MAEDTDANKETSTPEPQPANPVGPRGTGNELGNESYKGERVQPGDPR